jgi:hypothetical protein
MKVHGNCQCGEIDYEADVDPQSVLLCHCDDCQRLTGSVYRPIIHTSNVNFSLKKGNPRLYIKTGSSGKKRAHYFCGTCGSPIYSTDPETHEKLSLRVGGLKEKHAFSVAKQQWCASKLDWAINISEVPSIQNQ